MSKYYAVKKGRVPGIYRTWPECAKQIQGYPGAIYKSFSTEPEALDYINANPDINLDEKAFLSSDPNDYMTATAFVDGSYDIATKRYSCGVVIIKCGNVVHLSRVGGLPLANFDADDAVEMEEMTSMRNIAGEIMGALTAMKYAVDNGIDEIHIVHDYQGISSWALREWKCSKAATSHYRDMYDELSKSVKVKFVKVKGHTGVHWNEEADRLAKEALGLQK